MNKKIAIIGSGTAGIQLAYELLTASDFDVTIFSKETAEDIQKGKIRSTQVHFSSTLSRERQYQMPQWHEAPKLKAVHVSVGGQTLFYGYLDSSAQSVDQRLFLSDCLKDLREKGVEVVYKKITEDQLPQLVKAYDLIVDCTGRTGPIAPLPLNPYFPQISTPLRKCHVGYFHGIRSVEPLGIITHILPGEGELFEIPVLTECGPGTALFVEAIPNGKLDKFNNVRNADDMKIAMSEITRSFFPEISERIDLSQFDLCDDRAYLRMAIRPKAHFPYCLVNGKLVLGCGDSVVLNDPITGQGDNTASFMVQQLFFSLMEDLDTGWDEETGLKYWERIRPYVTRVTEWSNAMMHPLPEHILSLIMQGRENKTVAHRIANWFDNPTTAYNDFFNMNER